MLTLDRITLIDMNPALVRAWRFAFEDVPSVHVVHGDYFSVDADAMVSPANSFGFMDGGIDLPIRDTLGRIVEDRLQLLIEKQWGGELPVGSAELVSTDNARWPWLISAPTMRLPANVGDTLNAYLAFRAALLAIAAHDEARDGWGRPINTLVCCGLATATGQMPAKRCAVQMRMAYDAVNDPRSPRSLGEAFAQYHAQEAAMQEDAC